MRQSDLLMLLVRLGFRYAKPKASTWHSALIFLKSESALCVLLRKNGIDLRHYASGADRVKIGSGNVATFTGGDIYRSCYADTFKLNQRCLAVAAAFAEGNFDPKKIPGVKDRTQGTEDDLPF